MTDPIPAATAVPSSAPPLTKRLATRSITASPIGDIPKDYTEMSKLCRAAHLRYKDEDLEFRDKTGVVTDTLRYRTWFIVPDEGKPGEGIKTTAYRKFELLLKYIEFKNPGFARKHVLDAAVAGHKITLQSWAEMQNQMVKEGVPDLDSVETKQHKYERMRTAKGMKPHNFESFADVLE